MGEIVENDEIDRDTINPEEIEGLFNTKFTILTEIAVSLKKSYINKLTGTKSLKFAVSQSDNSLEVYQLNNTSLAKVCRLSGHEKTLTEVIFSPKEDNLLYSAGLDGVVKLWDTRSSGSCVQEYKDKEEEILRPYECLDMSSNSRVMCVGSQLVQDDAYIVFWDPRQTTPLGGYWNSHTDDITQVKFQPTKTETLASGSLDGLLNIYNILEPSEDDALTYSLNVENSIEKLSWLDDKRVACLTQSNDLQIWDSDSGDMLKSYQRDKISRSIKRSKEDDCYLVDTFTTADDKAVLLAGSYGGNGNVLRSVTIADKKLQPCSDFKQNKQVVRCCWYDKDRELLVTAGESGLISVWSKSHKQSDVPAKLTSPLNKLHANRSKPY